MVTAGNTYLYKGAPSLECRNIMLGNVIDCFDMYWLQSENKKSLLEFAMGQVDNPRETVARKARLFVKKHVMEGAG